MNGKVKTGVPGLDEMLGGGIPEGSVVLVMGEPGSGKTVLCSQFLYYGISELGERGVYVSLDHPKEVFMKKMSTFGWDFESFEREGLFKFIDASPFSSGKVRLGTKGFSIEALLKWVSSEIKRLNAKRIAIDSIASLLYQYPDIAKRRMAILYLIESLVKSGVTSMMTSMFRTGWRDTTVLVEEHLAHGVIILQLMRTGGELKRVIQIEKMLGTLVDIQPRPYDITEKGIVVHVDETVL